MSGFFIKCLSTRLKFDIDVFCVVQRSFLWYPTRIRANAELVNKGSMLELYVKVTDVALESAIKCPMSKAFSSPRFFPTAQKLSTSFNQETGWWQNRQDTHVKG